MRIAALLALVLLAPTPLESVAGELRIAAWNLEHLNDTGVEGYPPRMGPGYDALAGQVVAIGADIAAFQEVGNTAARRVFPAPHWHVEMSSRPIQEPGRACWDRPEARFGHVATGLAIHWGVAYRRNDDLKSLGEGDASQGWATDITVTAGGWDLRLLPVHLKTECWGAGEDRDERREETCAVLHSQMMHMKDWADARRVEGTAFVVLGDFNNRLAAPGDSAWGCCHRHRRHCIWRPQASSPGAIPGSRS